MVITNDVTLPTYEELTVPEVNVSSTVLRASAFHLGKYCENVNNEFMLCRAENNHDPRKCLAEGKDVTSCSLDFFRKMKKACRQSFEVYAECVDKSSTDFKLAPCRKSQGVFDKCMLDNLGLEREDFGYFCRVKVHDTKRPKPPPPEIQRFPDATPGLPEDYGKMPAKQGSRYIYE